MRFWDDEAQLIDQNFCTSLEYGLPPMGSCRMGINRKAMFLKDNYAIQAVLAFPFMRDDKQQKRAETAAEIVDIKPMPVEGIAHK